MPDLGVYLIGGGAVVVLWLLTVLKAVLWGAGRERDKQATAETQARDVADQVDNDIGALPGSKAREDLGKWSRG